MIIQKLSSVLIFLLTACGGESKGSDPETLVASVDRTNDLLRRTLPTVDNNLPTDWLRTSTGPFSIALPPDAVKVERQGIDSYVGRFQGSRCEVDFDYGLYSARANEPDELIDGMPARISIAEQIQRDDDYTYRASLNFSDIGRPQVNLVVVALCLSSSDGDTANTMLRSIKFE